MVVLSARIAAYRTACHSGRLAAIRSSFTFSSCARAFPTERHSFNAGSVLHISESLLSRHWTHPHHDACHTARKKFETRFAGVRRAGEAPVLYAPERATSKFPAVRREHGFVSASVAIRVSQSAIVVPVRPIASSAPIRVSTILASRVSAPRLRCIR
jgi:hypothetical protein